MSLLDVVIAVLPLIISVADTLRSFELWYLIHCWEGPTEARVVVSSGQGAV